MDGADDLPDNIGDHVVDMTRVRREVWLVKMPPVLSEVLELAQDGEHIADINIFEAAGGAAAAAAAAPPAGKRLAVPEPARAKRSRVEVKVRPDVASTYGPNTEYKVVPLDYSLKFHESKSMGIFSETQAEDPDDNPKLAVEGEITRRATCTPALTPEYQQLLKIRKELASSAAANKSKTLEKRVLTYQPKLYHEKPKSKADKLRERYERDSVENVQDKLFKLFQQCEYYKFKDLQRETRQPASHLREILRDIAEISTDPAHRHMWHLKEHLRHFDEQP